MHLRIMGRVNRNLTHGEKSETMNIYVPHVWEKRGKKADLKSEEITL
jgi:hypothetical protein